MLKVLLLLVVIGVVVYAGIRLWQRRWSPPSGRPAPRPVAPDDDPDFLRDLDRRRRDGELGP